MHELKWKLLSSEYLFRDNWATLRIDTCRMPSGNIYKPYYVLEYPDWVNAVALTQHGDVILIKQYRHAAAEVFLEIPGGCIDPGESAEDAIKRELLEETGYAFEKVELLSTLYANPATGNNQTFCFLATGGEKVQEQMLDEGEEIVIELIKPEQLKTLALNNKIGHALHASGIFYALIKLGLIS